MSENFHNPDKLKVQFVEHAVGSGIVVNAGAEGYVDTDVSAQTGTDTKKVWIIAVFTSASGKAGARPNGSAVDAFVSFNMSVTLVSHCSATGHMDLYRHAAGNNSYKFIGYLEVVEDA